jgi:predicted enzyme related to lactoylglutathione lyase
MNNKILAMSMSLTLVAGQLWAASGKAPKADVGPGRIVWFDLTTTSLALSKDFYGNLFDWQFTALQGTKYAVEIVSGGTAIGTLRVAEGKIGSFNGVVYVQVNDIQLSSKKAVALGGTVVPGFPFDLSEGGGAISLVIDPAGHPIGLYSRTPLVKVTAESK